MGEKIQFLEATEGLMMANWMVTNPRPMVHVNEKIMQFFFVFQKLILKRVRHFRDAATQSLRNENSVVLVYLLRVIVIGNTV